MHTLFSILATGDGTLNTLGWWIRYRGETRIRFGWAVLAESQANMVTKPGIETVNAEADVPTAAVLGTQTMTSTGLVYPNGWITTSWTTATDGKQLWRPALYVRNSTALQNVRVFSWYELEDCYHIGDGRVLDAPGGSFEYVTAGYLQSCALGTDGSISCWGEGMEADGRDGNFTQVAAGPGMTCSIDVDDAAACWGGWYNEDDGMAWAWEPGGAFVDIDGGDDTCAIGSDGAIECHYGSEPPFFEGPPPEGTFTDLALGDGGCAIGEDGAITCWGRTPRSDGDAPEDRF